MTIKTNFPEVWQEHWQTSGFREPSLIQEKSFLPLKAGKNVIGISPTGSGKTLAYIWPLLLSIEPNQPGQLLILAPSQELAVQISQVVREWATLIGLKTQALIGGANVNRQIENLKNKPEILVGTPGRVLELIKVKKIKAHNIKTIVMDEVDQLFHDQELNLTKQIVASAPKEFQLVFYSATADRVVSQAQQLANELLVLDVTEEDHSQGNVSHYFMTLAPRKKSDYLRSLSYTTDFRAMVFFNQVAELGTVEEKLVYEGVQAVGLASDQNKTLRKLAIHQFSTQEARLLLTTDIGARGLDFDQIPFVVNAEVPLSEESYIHRAGRVGRMGASGSVITFVNDGTKRDYQRLMKKLDYTSKELFLYDGALQLQRKERSEARRTEKKQGPAISTMSKGKKRNKKSNHKSARKKT